MLGVSRSKETNKYGRIHKRWRSPSKPLKSPSPPFFWLKWIFKTTGVMSVRTQTDIPMVTRTPSRSLPHLSVIRTGITVSRKVCIFDSKTVIKYKNINETFSLCYD